MINRHPTKKKSKKPTDIHTPISLGKKDKKLLIHLLNNQNARFNVRNYSINNNTTRSTVYDILNRLKKQGFVDRQTGNNRITEKGIIYINELPNLPIEIDYRNSNHGINKCIYCGKKLSKLIRKKKFCSSKCRIQYRIKRIKKKEGYANKEFQCSLCGFSKYPEAIDLHHIDKDRKNNKINNLLEVCANCHRRLHAMSPKKYSYYLKTHILREWEKEIN